jgi:two-component system phosphate regulon response regulator OmpR
MNQPILICDDDPVIVNLASKILNRAGFSTQSTGTGHELLQKLDESTVAPTLIILDIQLPDMDTKTILQTCRGQYPDLPILICSGHRPDAEVQNWLSSGRTFFLQKPFGLNSLTQAVQSIVNNA